MLGFVHMRCFLFHYLYADVLILALANGKLIFMVTKPSGTRYVHMHNIYVEIAPKSDVVLNDFA